MLTQQYLPFFVNFFGNYMSIVLQSLSLTKWICIQISTIHCSWGCYECISHMIFSLVFRSYFENFKSHVSAGPVSEFSVLHPKIRFIACEFKFRFAFAFTSVISVLYALQSFLHTQCLNLVLGCHVTLGFGISFSAGFLWFRGQFRVWLNWNASCLGHGFLLVIESSW